MTTSVLLLWIVVTLCVFFSVYVLLNDWLTMQVANRRLAYRQYNRWFNRLSRTLQRYERPYQFVVAMLESIQIRTSPEAIFIVTVCCFIVGSVSGWAIFQSYKGTFLFAAMLTSMPFAILFSMLIQRRMKLQADFLPAVELYYQCCLVSGGRHIRTSLAKMIEEDRLIGPTKSVFEQLYRNLSVKGDDEASLRVFAVSLGHIWADYFVNILRAGLQEGHQVTGSLKQLINDMRKARLANQQERNKLLEIRIANFTPIIFLALFVGINIRFNRTGAYLYYVLDAHGRDLILNSIVLIFVSFMIGLWLSRKKM